MMNEKTTKDKSKFLSLVLRHAPDKIGLILDENGWANVAELIEKTNAHNHKIDFELLNLIVDTSDKKRFAFNEDKTKIRANQGHSISVDLELKSVVPPDYLFHGTMEKFMESIKKTGLQKMSRHHVHLSSEKTTAEKVGSRRGKPVILIIHSKRMFEDGFKFYLSENGVWLTDQVPEKYIQF